MNWISMPMLQIDPHTLTTGDVGRALGYTDEWVRQHDAELKPQRRANGRRYYDPRVVEQFAKRRAVRETR